MAGPGERHFTSNLPEIRRAEEGDVAAIAAIYGHYVRHGLASFEEEAPTSEELARRRGDVLARGLPYLVSVHDGRITGFAYAAPYRTRSAYRFTLEDSVYVAVDCAGRGIGTALLGRLIGDCSDFGYRQMVAVIGDSANRGSIRLHESAGFAIVGTLRSVGFKHGRWVDSVLMQRDLGPGDGTLPAADLSVGMRK